MPEPTLFAAPSAAEIKERKENRVRNCKHDWIHTTAKRVSIF